MTKHYLVDTIPAKRRVKMRIARTWAFALFLWRRYVYSGNSNRLSCRKYP